jgi:hypothetical protein
MSELGNKITSMRGPETAFVTEVLDVVERHSSRLSVHQICGGLFEVACEVLEGQKEEI